MPDVLVQTPVLYRLGDVLGLDVFYTFKIGNGAGDLKDFVIGARWRAFTKTYLDARPFLRSGGYPARGWKRALAYPELSYPAYTCASPSTDLMAQHWKFSSPDKTKKEKSP